jgi:hypothetical protein
MRNSLFTGICLVGLLVPQSTHAQQRKSFVVRQGPATFYVQRQPGMCGNTLPAPRNYRRPPPSWMFSNPPSYRQAPAAAARYYSGTQIMRGAKGARWIAGRAVRGGPVGMLLWPGVAE